MFTPIRSAIIAIPLGLALSLSVGACQRAPAPAPSAASRAPSEEASAQQANAPPVVPQLPAPFATPPVLSGTPDVATLVAKVKPAVVNITTVHETKTPARELDPFEFFGRRAPRGGGGDRVMRQTALGSGFIIDPKGYVVTNNHFRGQAIVNAVELEASLGMEAKMPPQLKEAYPGR